MKYELPVVVSPLPEKGFIARCEPVRATATGKSREEAMANLQEAITEMVAEFGKEAVFQDISPESEIRIVEVAI